MIQKYHFPSFWNSLSSTNRISTLSAILFCFHSEHQIEVGLDADVSENRLPFESPSINNFSGIDISQSLDQEPSSLSPHFLLHLWMTVSLQLKQFKTWLRKVKGIMVGQLYLRLYLFYQAEIFPDYKTRRPLLPSLIILNLSDHMTRHVIILLKFSKSAN